MSDALAVACCVLGIGFLLMAWKALVSRREVPSQGPERRKFSWVGLLLHLVFSHTEADRNPLDRFTEVAAMLLAGAVFLGGGLYLGFQ